MSTEHIVDRLSEYLDGDLDGSTLSNVDAHLATCPECRSELDTIRSVRDQLAALPSEVWPPRAVWERIERRIAPSAPTREARPSFFRPGIIWKAAAALVIAVGSFWLARPEDPATWHVRSLAGQTVVEGSTLRGSRSVEAGDRVATGLDSRAELKLGTIGSALVGPSSSIRVLRTTAEEHRMNLEVGHVYASVWSPPRVFIVETPAAVAVDLGCTYELTVDSAGVSLLTVLGGEVALETPMGSSIVLAGFWCESVPGRGPGLPVSFDAGAEFASAVRTFDRSGALADRIIRLSEREDAVTILHLLMRTQGATFRSAYQRLAGWHKPPEGVTLEGLTARDAYMFEQWLNSFATRFIPLDRPPTGLPKDISP